MAHEPMVAQAQNLLARIALGDFSAFAITAVAPDGSAEEVISVPVGSGETLRLIGALHSVIIDLHGNIYRVNRCDEPPTPSA